ncbi:hypothetical protein [Flavobacterium pectinovorum]|uniref:hypothetical protein n=1 Tax=Flavobacterium pectinovorum TaxID=29533 RepID=UPI001FAE5986|nr:hypothetical protein [Flavobacterium pectinovorum]MCI9846001.1 hypothetical protein [Flavobacterium pectinovorum]
MDKRLHFKNLVEKCEQKFGRGNSQNWKHNDYNDISKEILEKTKINISYNTLKRIFGKIPTDKYYLPQQATFDALMEYSDFDINEKYNQDSDLEILSDQFINSKAIKKSKAGFFLVFLLISVGLSCFLLNEFYFNDGNYSLKIESSEGKLPKTCFFKVNIPNTKDSVFINFGDKSRLMYLNPGQKLVSHIYFIPGVFDVILTNRTKEFAKSKVYVTTNKKWVGLAFKRQRYIPKSFYAFPANKNQDSVFHISNSQLEKQGVDISEKFFVRLCNYNPIDDNGDAFIFETAFKKDIDNEGISCNGFVFKISGANNTILFNFVNSGCSSRIINVVSEKNIDGVTHNLSPFVIDFQKWNQIKLVNNNKTLSLFVNNILIYKTTYQSSLGNLRGISVEFERNGFIKDCSLSSLNGTKYYHF